MNSLLAVALGYALGSVPFGLLLTRAFGAGDIRSIGSGNIGATNVLRTGRKGLAAGTLLLDLGKGFAAVWMTRILFPGTEQWGALAAVIGHCFPIWLGFKGGKGVATKLGVALGLGWLIGLASAGVWLAVFALTRISSLGGMAAAVAAPMVALYLGQAYAAPALGGIALLVLWQHRANISRLIAGTEPKVGGNKPK